LYKQSKNEKANILYIIGDLGKGGQERQLIYVLKEFSIEGSANLFLVVWNHMPEHIKIIEELKSLGIKIFLFDLATSSFSKLIQLRKIITAKNIDIVHSFIFSKNIYAYLSTLFTKATPIGALRGSFKFIRKKYNTLISMLNGAFPPAIVSNNTMGMNELRATLPTYLNKKFFTLKNKLDLNNFPLKPLPENQIIQTISIGRLTPEKRIDLLIDLIKSIIDSGYKIQHKHFGSGKLDHQLQNYLEEKKVTAFFEFKGTTEDVSSVISEAHFLIHTSDTEGMPNVIMESFACGRTVLSTACGDAPLIIDHQENGIIVPCGDLDALLKGFEYLYFNRQFIYQYGEKARTKAEKAFDISTLTKDVSTIYNALTKDKFKLQPQTVS
jgi:GalNAc-alpha-(1->4)-GalNAc-alpha-(1->3)-diNAcBac-PP-undecaprenol alpha-1,4-N-acetyl-D-galactosaminyltransferase